MLYDTPAPLKVEWGHTGFTLTSVGLSVCRLGFWNFMKNYWLNHLIPGILPYGLSLLIPIHFPVPSINFGPLVAKYLAKNWVSRT